MPSEVGTIKGDIIMSKNTQQYPPESRKHLSAGSFRLKVLDKIEDLRAEMVELHCLLKEYPDTFFERLNTIDNLIRKFRNYFVECLSKGLVKSNPKPLPDAEKIAEFIKENIPESRQFDVLLWLTSEFPPKGTFKEPENNFKS